MAPGSGDIVNACQQLISIPGLNPTHGYHLGLFQALARHLAGPARQEAIRQAFDTYLRTAGTAN